MRKLILMVGLVVVGIACGDAVGEMLDVPDAGAQPSDGSSMQYAGNTSGAYSPDIGLYAAYAACQSDFGEGHRVCERDEIHYTTKLPNLAEGSLAWYGTTSCQSWAINSPSYTAGVVNDKGNTTEAGDGLTGVSSSCVGSESRPFACCGPK
jgi:hypothetical protein